MSNGHSVAGLRPPPASSDLLAPLRITSSSAAVRVGDYGPALIMNLDAQATVWIGRNGDVTSTRGVPVPAGQSVPWVGGELWAILGADTQSLASGSATIVVTTYVHDWQNQAVIATAVLNSGVVQVDNPAILLAGTMNANDTRTLAVSTWQCVTLITSPAGVTGTQRQVVLNWEDSSGDVVSQDSYKWSLSPDTTLVLETLPCRGSQLVIQCLGGGANTQSVIVVASHRPFVPLMRGPFDRLVFNSQFTNVPASNGSTIINSSVRYDGPAYVTWNLTSAATAAAAAFIFVNERGSGSPVFAVRDPGALDGGFSRNFGTAKIAIPRNGFSVQVSNENATNVLNGAVLIVASPEG